MEIATCFNKNYVMPAGVMLTSLFENNRDVPIHVHVLARGAEDFAQPVVDIVKKYHGEISFYDMSACQLPELPVNGRNQRANIPIETYFRLFLSEVLPPELDKVLWLDGDMVINGDISDLWKEDVTDYAVGAVPDFENNNVHNMNRLGYDAAFGYFNGGVLLINLKHWRENHVFQSFMDYIEKHFELLNLYDQDVLNYVLHASKKELSIRFNFQTTFLFKKRLMNISCKYFPQIDTYAASPCIVHFTEHKPWLHGSINPMRDLFVKYQNMTQWQGIEVKRKKSLRKRMETAFLCLWKREPLKRILYDPKYVQ